MKSVATQRPLRLNDVPDPVILPADAWASIKQFVLDKKTGNLTLKIRNGKVLGARVEELVSFKR